MGVKSSYPPVLNSPKSAFGKKKKFKQSESAGEDNESSLGDEVEDESNETSDEEVGEKEVIQENIEIKGDLEHGYNLIKEGKIVGWARTRKDARDASRK